MELSDSHAIVTGSGGDQLRPDDVLSGERVAEHDDPGLSRDSSSVSDMTEVLAGFLGLPALGIAARDGYDWSPVEVELGVKLPEDYKRFIDSYGAGLIDGHVTVCAPGELRDWAELVQHNAFAHECVRLDFGGPDNDPEGWHLADSSQDRLPVVRGRPAGHAPVGWFEPDTVCFEPAHSVVEAGLRKWALSDDELAAVRRGCCQRAGDPRRRWLAAVSARGEAGGAA
ncbi:hypothetical protein [Micromonospora sp. NPDC093277]|uniref:hypothetical protein n=1 Tax=Micromonospora sp. NPDC093277 TaxID=3364291 RepID=UPI0037FCF3DA